MQSASSLRVSTVPVAVVLLLVPAIVLLLIPAASAQGPDADWRTVETAHFRVHFPAEMEGWALATTARLESVRERLVDVIGYDPPDRIDVLVVDPVGRANGMALALLGAPRMVLYATPPAPESVLGSFADWSELLVVHETAHLLHLLRPSRSPWQQLVEHVLPVGPMALGAPRWVVEGYATMLEGELTASGRPSSDLRAAILRRRAQAGMLPTYDAMSSDQQSWLGMSMAYLAGSAFLEWLVEREGPQSLRDLWARATAREGRGFDDAFAGVFSDTPRRLYGRFTAELTYRAMTVEQQIAPELRDGELWQDMSWSTGWPQVAPDGSRLAVVRRRRKHPAELLILATAPPVEETRQLDERRDRMLARDPEDVGAVRTRPVGREPLARLEEREGSGLATPRWDRTGTWLVYVRFEPDADGIVRPDLYRWWPEEDRVERLTRGAGVRDPDPLPDGRAVVAVRHRHGASGLVEVELATGTVRELDEPRLDTVVASPRVDPDGRRVAYLRHRDRAWQLVVRDLQADHGDVAPGAGELVLGPAPEGRPTIAFPAWSPDGTRIYASVGRDGLIDIVAFDPDGQRPPERIVRSQGAALAPAPTPDGHALLYLSLEADGLDLRRLELGASAPGSGTSAEVQQASLAPAVRPEPLPEPEPFRLEQLPRSRPYGVGRQEASLLLGGFRAPSAAGTELGVRLGDVVGRLDLLLVGATATDGGTRGGLLAAAWRGWPVELTASVFSGEDRPSTQPRRVPELGTELDLERTGLLIEASWDRAWHAGGIGLEGRGLVVELEDNGAADRRSARERQRSLSLGLRLDQELQHGRWRLGGSLRPSAEVGTDGADQWSRWGTDLGLRVHSDTASLELAWQRQGSGGEPGLGDSGGPAGRYQLGGLPMTIVPRWSQPQQLPAPALPVGAVIGDEHEAQVVRVTWARVPVFFERHRLWSHGADRGPWLRIIGLELEMELPPLALARLPGAELRLGAARVLDAPYAGLGNIDEWWLGLAWRP